MNYPLNITNVTAQLQKRLATPQAFSVARNLLILLFLLWSCFTLARLFWLLVPSPALPEASNATPRNTVVATKSSGGSSVDTEALLAAELFGPLDTNAPEPEAPPPTETLTAEVVTSLNLTLKGVIRSSIPANSEAIIAHGRQEKTYRVGDDLPGGSRVKLLQVNADQVILENSGRREALKLFDESKITGSTSRSRSSFSPSSRRSSASFSSNRSGLSEVELERIREYEQFQAEQGRGAVSQYDEEGDDQDDTRSISRRPTSLSDVIKFSIAREGGSIVGYKIRPGRDRELFTELGLQTNDIVTEINGIALTSSGSVTQVYREMRTATSAAIEILRDGQSLQMNIELDTQ